MVTPIATPNDVRSRLNLPEPGTAGAGISGPDISTYLEDAAFENARANDIDEMADDLRKQIEWRLAGLKILSYRKGLRSYHQQSLGSMSRSYEAKSIAELKSEVKDLDPSGTLATTVRRDTDRNVRRARSNPQ